MGSQRRNGILEITVEKIVYPGRSLGRGKEGVVIFTDGALEGEVVEVEIYKKKKSFSEGKLRKIIERSPHRINPRCPSFGYCGGCTFQHTDYENQILIKEGYLKELFKPFNISINFFIKSPEEWGYRNKMEFSFYQENSKVNLGLHQKGEFNKFFPVPPCFICDPDFLPLIELVLDFVRESGLPAYNLKTHQGVYRHLVLRKGKRTGDLLINLVTNKSLKISKDIFAPLQKALERRGVTFYWTINSSFSDAVVAEDTYLIEGKEKIEEKLIIKDRKYTFTISPFSFFQTNTFGTEKLYETIINLLKSDQDTKVLDLYCGTGTISLIIAPYVKEVIGVDQFNDAIRDAEENKKINQIENVFFRADSVEKWIRESKEYFFNSIILDPPRCGVSKRVINYIEAIKPDQILYISCNPSTMVRDLKGILEKVSYQIEKVILVDLFPQTYHVEVVVALKRWVK